jgi:hypothetical protein
VHNPLAPLATPQRLSASQCIRWSALAARAQQRPPDYSGDDGSMVRDE